MPTSFHAQFSTGDNTNKIPLLWRILEETLRVASIYARVGILFAFTGGPELMYKFVLKVVLYPMTGLKRSVSFCITTTTKTQTHTL